MEFTDLTLRVAFERLRLEAGAPALEPRWAGSGPRPALDIYETASAFVIAVEVPGVPPEHLEVVGADRTLVIRGIKTDPVPGGRAVRHRLEIATGPFELIVELPGGAEAGQARAELRHGRLTVTVPKPPSVTVRLERRRGG